MAEEQQIPLAIAGVSHHTANVAAIEAFRFGGEQEFLLEAAGHFSGALLLQTCNRVEIIVEGDLDSLKSFLGKRGREDFLYTTGSGRSGTCLPSRPVLIR